MTEIFNDKNQTKFRKTLRNNTPSAEKVLWKKLQNRKVNNLKFRRQYGIGRFIVDFYCPKLKLAIEVDGITHSFYDKNIKEDLSRQKEIESLGIKVIRFTNVDIYHNINEVMNVIYNETSPSPLLRKEGEDNKIEN